MKGVMRHMEIILVVFFGKILIWNKWLILGPKMVRSHNSRSTLKSFEILHNERAEEVHENYINVFSKKVSFWASGPF